MRLITQQITLGVRVDGICPNCFRKLDFSAEFDFQLSTPAQTPAAPKTSAFVICPSCRNTLFEVRQ